MQSSGAATSPFDPPSAAERSEAAACGMSLALWARFVPDEVAIISPAGDRTFRQLNRNINRLVRVLRSKGLRSGDAVALVAGNRAEFAEIVHACLRTGLRYTPVNRYLKPDEVAYVVDDCGARALFGDTRYAELMVETRPLCSRVAVALSVGGEIDGFDSYDSALNEESGDDLADPELGSRMLYTSGTTGRPKGVVRPANYSTRLEALTDAPRYAAGTGQRNLCTGPLYHGGPLGFSMLAPLANGVGTVLMDRWDAESALALIERYRITHTHMVPTMFHRLLRLPDAVRTNADVSSLRYVLHGAAPCPVETKRAMIDWFGPIIWEYFAATEGSGASISSEDWLRKPGSVGVPPTIDHVRILDDDGHDCAVGQPGRIHLKRVDEMSFEYFGDPAKTAASHRDNYFSVGDIGYLDSDGFLFVTDRDAEIIVSGGVNIYPAEIESVLLAHPVVRDAAVIGIPNPEWGEEVKAVVECDSGDRNVGVEADLAAFCRDRLAAFKRPRSIDLVGELPRQDNGKLYRNRLRDRYR